MTRYLLAAEADKIQDIIFRVSRLREVGGGSQLLSRFCQEGAIALLEKHDGNPDEDIIINDGGAFRILFNNESMAIDYGKDLAELYRRFLGGHLSVACPVTYSDDEFTASSMQAKEKLREAKMRGHISASAAHLPYLAFCASCGVALANDHRSKLTERLADPTDRPNYLCVNCAGKAEQRYRGKRTFIGSFRKLVRKHLPADLRHPKHYALDTPEKNDWADAIGALDPRRYVAYLLADGNGMGRLFDSCRSREQMIKLSSGLNQVLSESLARPCAELIEQQQSIRNLDNKILPVLPLILGGDDLFALLPAPWALDFAARFCTIYQSNMARTLEEEIELKDKQPTIAAAVVICKANYPHALAHKRGEHELKRAKKMARYLETKNQAASILNFALITGNQVIGSVEESASNLRFRSSLRPYFVSDGFSKELGQNIQTLFKMRYQLRALPGKRRAELEYLYARQPIDDKDLSDWLLDLKWLSKRIGRDSQLSEVFATALSELGDTDEEKGHWRGLYRPWESDFAAHGLPDLLELWDFALQLDKSAKEYEV